MAIPQNFEVWFLSNPKTQQVLNLIKEKKQRPLLLSQAELSCQPMGEYCFDPQVGLYKKDQGEIQYGSSSSILDEDLPQLPVAKSVDRNLIVCESGVYFDIFCGKSNLNETRKINFDLWIDTSSSMREMDPIREGQGCFREKFVKKLTDKCPWGEKVHIMQFDTEIKPAGSATNLCANEGLNDLKRIIKWIEESTARNLIIVTDLYEYHQELADFVFKNKGKLRGEKGDLSASDLLSMSDHLVNYCK